jgi:hypothetical protein
MGSYEQLEAELLAFLKPEETVADFLRRTHEEHVHTGGGCLVRSRRQRTAAAASTAAAPDAGLHIIDQNVALRPGSVVEVVGPAQSAKSELLMQAGAWWAGARSARRGCVGAAGGQGAHWVGSGDQAPRPIAAVRRLLPMSCSPGEARGRGQRPPPSPTRVGGWARGPPGRARA